MVALILGHSLPFGHINMNFVCEREYVIKCKMPIYLYLERVPRGIILVSDHLCLKISIH